MQLTWQRLLLHTRDQFRIARPGASVSGRNVERIIVRIEHDGVTGLGEAAPTPYYNQSLDSVEDTLEQAAKMLAGAARDPKAAELQHLEFIESIIDDLLARFDNQRAAVAAVDQALHDWLGRRQGIPVWQLLGLDPSQTPPTSMTIGLDTPNVVERKVRQAAEFDILKIKVGTPDDVQTLTAVRRAAGRKRIRVDANGGWPADEAAQRIAKLLPFDLELIEQPIPAESGDRKGVNLRQLRESLPDPHPPIIADEDCVRPADLTQLAGAVDGVNIKLAKCGGMVEARRMIHRARELGLAVMIGCMVETSVGIAAAAHLASLADYTDLDGHLLLADDPFAGLELESGVVRPGATPGLGVQAH